MSERLTEINFCLRCGTPLEKRLRFGRERPVCPACGWTYFADPKAAAAVLVVQAGRVLLVQRAHPPRRGAWTLPAGFIDAGESPAEAAARECLEETGLRVRVTGLLDVIAGSEHERGADFVIAYLATVLDGTLSPADDALAAEWFSPDDLPPLAFAATRQILDAWRQRQ